MSLNSSAGYGAAILGAQFVSSQSVHKEPHTVLSHLTVHCGRTKTEAGPSTLSPLLDPDSRFTLWLLGVTFTLIMCFAVPYFHGRYILSV